MSTKCQPGLLLGSYIRERAQNTTLEQTLELSLMLSEQSKPFTDAVGADHSCEMKLNCYK